MKISLALVCGLAAPLGVISTSFAQVGTPHRYCLGEGSEFEMGCFEPCQCPVFFSGEVRGTFDLTLDPIHPPGRSYTVSNVDWSVHDSAGIDRHFTGSGAYTIQEVNPPTHRLTLDLVQDGGEVRHFDSRVVDMGDGFPTRFDIDLAINGFVCFDTGFLVHAQLCDAPSCPADWNRDGAVNSADFFDFVAAFFSGSADFNMDGATDSQDFFDFVTAFFAGCG